MNYKIQMVKHALFLSLIIILIAILAICLYKKGHWWGDDFALYVSQANAICNNSIDELIAVNRFAIENSSVKGFSPTTAPWGFPILLTPMVYTLGINMEAFKLMIILFFLAFTLTWYFAFKRSLPPYLLLISIALLGTNVNFLVMLNNVQSEIPYLFFAVLSLWLIQLFIEGPTILKGISLGFVICFTFLIRTEGLLWLISLFACQLSTIIRHQLYKKENRTLPLALSFAAPYACFLLLFVLMSYLLPNGFLDHADRLVIPALSEVGEIISMYFSRFGQILTGGTSLIFSFMAISLFLTGVIYRFLKDLPVAVYTIIAMILFIIWPFREFRYAMLLFPFVFYFILQGVIILSGKILPGLYRPVLVIAFLSCCMIQNAFTLYAEIKNKGDYYEAGPETTESREMFSYIREKTNNTDTVIFFRPRAMALYTNRKSAMISDNWFNIVKKGTYYVFDKDPNTIFQFNASHPFIGTPPFKKYFSSVFENGQFIVYQIKR